VVIAGGEYLTRTTAKWLADADADFPAGGVFKMADVSEEQYYDEEDY
jgi:hypothetical protein